jgi:hypothetical protein
MSDSVSGDRRGPPMCGPLVSRPSQEHAPWECRCCSGRLPQSCKRSPANTVQTNQSKPDALSPTRHHGRTFPTRPDGTRRHLPDPDGMWVHDPGGEQGAALKARRRAVSDAPRGSLQTRCRHAGGHGWRTGRIGGLRWTVQRASVELRGSAHCRRVSRPVRPVRPD